MCANGNFQLETTAKDGVNEGCSSLGKDDRLTCILTRALKNQKELPSHTNNIFLTHTQLSEKCIDLRKQRNLLQLQVITKAKQLYRLNKVLSLHQRFMVLISENNVLRVKELVSVALRHHRSINYIVEKVSMAVNKVYRARPSEEDKDLAFIVLKLGGPTLLDILCKANKLPSSSLAYRMGSGMKHVYSPVTMSAAECMKNNLDLETFSSSYSASQKMDETFLTPRVRYDSKYNAFQGLCHEHAPSDLQFDTIEDFEKIADAIRNEELHAPKECLTVGMYRMDCKSKLNVIIAWPTCSKKDYDGTWDLLSSTSREYHRLTGKNMMNICSDADPTRKLVLHNYCSEELCELSNIFPILNNIPLLDLCSGPYEETVSYDPKHLVKRCWCSAINGTISINDVILNSEDLRNLLLLVETNGLTVDNLIKPSDKQNVPNATKFLLTFTKAVRDDDLTLPYRLEGIKADMKMLSYVYEALLSFYVHPQDTTISTQITAISIGAHALLYLHRTHRSKIMSNQLVHDIQATFQDAIFCCAKAQTYFPDKPLFLVKNGTDPVETFFGAVRAKNKNCNMDSLEFIHCATAMAQVDNLLLNKHTEWSKAKHASKRLCLDYSSVSDWKEEDLILKDVDICRRFKIGKLTVSSKLIELGLNDIDFDALATEGSTFMKPFGQFIGVDDSEHDWSIPVGEVSDSDDDDDDNDDETADEVDENQEDDYSDINIGDFIAGKHDATVEIDGKHVYKATCVKELLTSHPISKDRLKRVRTLSSPSSTNSEAPPKLLYIGDPVVASKSTGNVIANIKDIRLANKKVKHIDMSLLEASNLKLDLVAITLEEQDGKYYWTGAFEGETFSMTGKDIIPVQPEVNLEMKADDCTPYCFDKQLVLDIGVHLQQQPSDTMARPGSSKGTNGARSKSATGGNTSPLRPCLICNKETSLESMRGHVAYHILTSDDLHDVCGFCGRQGSLCQSQVGQSSHTGAEVFYAKVTSSCDYQYDYKRVPNDTTKTHKCTNKVVRCSANNCKCSIWRYNAVHHYENNHPNVDIPADFLVSEKEKGIVLRVFKL